MKGRGLHLLAAEVPPGAQQRKSLHELLPRAYSVLIEKMKGNLFYIIILKNIHREKIYSDSTLNSKFT